MRKSVFKSMCLIICVSLAACASTGKSVKTAPPDDSKADVVLKKETQPRVTFASDEVYLGDVVHQLGEQVGGSLVLMKGVELRAAKPVNLKRASYASLVKTLANDSGCAVQECAGYSFLYPSESKDYDALREVSLSGKLDPSYAKVNVAMTFGYGTRLYSALAVLSHVMGITVVADNAVAEAQCGEITLGEVPLEVALEALLKSARIAQFRMDSGSEYIFFGHPENANPPLLLLNEDALDDHKREVLDQKVTVYLPHPPQDPRRFEVPEGPSKLRDVLSALSAQLGVTVTAERALEDFPINPVVLNKVRLRTALDLIVRQWLVGDFGYQVVGDTILIRRK